MRISGKIKQFKSIHSGKYCFLFLPSFFSIVVQLKKKNNNNNKEQTEKTKNNEQNGHTEITPQRIQYVINKMIN